MCDRVLDKYDRLLDTEVRLLDRHDRVIEAELFPCLLFGFLLDLFRLKRSCQIRLAVFLFFLPSLIRVGCPES